MGLARRGSHGRGGVGSGAGTASMATVVESSAETEGKRKA